MTGALREDRKLARYIVVAQLMLTLSLAMVSLLMGVVTASAAFAGGIIGAAASGCFALVSLRSGESIFEHNAGLERSSGQEKSAGKILLDFYLGQATKWLVIVISMALAFNYLPGIDQNLNILVLLGVFLLTQSAYVAVPVYLKKTAMP